MIAGLITPFFLSLSLTYKTKDQMKHKPLILKESYILDENATGFYGKEIEKGTVLFTLYKQVEPITQNRALHYRFVFDTIKEGVCDPNNKRISIWYTKKVGFDTKLI